MSDSDDTPYKDRIAYLVSILVETLSGRMAGNDALKAIDSVAGRPNIPESETPGNQQHDT